MAGAPGENGILIVMLYVGGLEKEREQEHVAKAGVNVGVGVNMRNLNLVNFGPKTVFKLYLIRNSYFGVENVIFEKSERKQKISGSANFQSESGVRKLFI